MRRWILWMIVVYIMVLITTGYNGGNNSFTNPIGSNGGGTLNLVNDAKHIDTNGNDWYNSILFDPITNKYYISAWQEDTTRKLALISINPDLTLNYSKYYEVQDSSNNTLSNIGLTNLWYKDNNKFYVGGWLGNVTINPHGIIGEADKNSGQITLKKIFQNISFLYIISDRSSIYGVSDGGYILKLDNNYTIVSSKQAIYSLFDAVSISTNYIITYNSLDCNRGVVVIKKDLSNAVIFNNDQYIPHAALVDNDNILYYIDGKPGSNSLFLLKVNITNLDNPIQKMVKEYIRNSIALFAQMGFSLDGNIILGITTNESPENIVLLKINKNNFNIMNQVELSAKSGGNSELWENLNIMPLPDSGFIISGSINNAGYILKGPGTLI
jgi:hypothetical protein